ncbi:MAG: GatB/YqeY domain-containing protein [Chloroflexi bacterium]|nr:GatB/YqeY domain-containing protein [Chloroflexota bacterium]
MDLNAQLAADLKDAMRARDEIRRNVLRLTIAALRNAAIAAGEELGGEATMAVVSTEAKRRRESIQEFRKAGRQDLVEKEEAELAVLAVYLPEPLSRDEIIEAVRRVIEETGAAGAKDLGKVMPVLMQKFQGRADGREVSEVVRELLS